MDDNGNWLPHAIINNDIIIVCDGSFQPTRSTSRGGAAWIIECKSTKKKVIGYLSSTSTDGGSYRSELTGIYAALTYTLAVTKAHNITSGHVDVHCDNEKALLLSSTICSRLPQKTSHADIIRLIRFTCWQLPISVHFQHIYGHQDKWLPYSSLDRPSQLNVICDKLAKVGLQRDIQYNNPRHDLLPRESVAIFIDDIKVTGSVGGLLRNATSKQHLRAHLDQKGTIASTIFDSVDWKGIQFAMAHSSTRFKLWATKHVSGFSATNKTMSYRSPLHSTSCPCCQLPDIIEDTHHQIHCTNPERQQLWQDTLSNLSSWLDSHDCEPHLSITILTYLSNKGAIAFTQSTPPNLSFSDIQDQIGWDNFIEGKITTEIRDIQHSYLCSISSRISIDKWIGTFISQLLHLIHSQWLFRNEIVHRKSQDGLSQAEAAQIRIAIRVQLRLGIQNLDEEDHFLLQHTYDDISTWSGIEKKLWLSAIKAARLAAASNIQPDP